MFSRRAQNLLEYATLLGIIVFALLIMQVYVKRAYQGRLKQDADTLGQQYSPGHTAGLTTTQWTVRSESYSGAGIYHSRIRGRDITLPEGISVGISNTDTNFSRQERTDSFAAEND